MRRKEKEITDPTAIDAVINRAIVCRIALSENNTPYIVPVCFGYKDRTLYFHCASEGKKLDILRHNPAVCFEIDEGVELKKDALACNWGMRYKSVIGSGNAVVLESMREKETALSIIMAHYSNEAFSFPQESIAKITVVKIAVETLTGKQSGSALAAVTRCFL
jgi:hypothetical protein